MRVSRKGVNGDDVAVLQVIRLRFSHVSLWGQSASDTAAAQTCSDVADRLTVEQRRRKPVCVTATTNTLTTRTNQATVRFVTNELGHALGFRAFYRAGQPALHHAVLCVCVCVCVCVIKTATHRPTLSAVRNDVVGRYVACFIGLHVY